MKKPTNTKTISKKSVPYTGAHFSMACYYREVSFFPLLSREQEIELGRKIQKGDSAALEKMINANLRLVVKIANDYARCGLPLEDLICEGNIGLMKAAERYDPDFGARFATYAAWWIKQKIKRALGNQSRTIRLPIHVSQRVRTLNEAARELGDELGRDPADHELTECPGLSRKQVTELRRVSQPVVSLDEPVSADGIDHADLRETVPDETAPDPSTAVETKDMNDNLREAVSILGKRDREIITLRFGLDGGDPQTLEQLGQRFNVSRERIRQLQMVALEKLRHAMQRLDRRIPQKTRTAPRSPNVRPQPLPEAVPA